MSSSLIDKKYSTNSIAKFASCTYLIDFTHAKEHSLDFGFQGMFHGTNVGNGLDRKLVEGMCHDIFRV
jgi:hypothetical protein